MIQKMTPSTKEIDFQTLSRSLLDIAWSFGPKGLDSACCKDLGIAEFLALDDISRTIDYPVHQVGSTLGFTKSGATRIVNRLVTKGYVSKRTSGHDGRVCCLDVTDRGREILSEAYANYETILRRIFAGLDSTKRDALRESLIQFSTLLMQEGSQEGNR
ncbi:MarR family transcriptional regulator [Sphaerochaeta halotolerans]|jgi:DNA-binding MarR family transcriptional regulator|uniref:MarR family transcriptional regulator n=2 Tax=Sphaerochaeta halotolerans TaxID=2293840 RepID=A0A372MGF5_9SPIR|nr:MarR family transcriptional regulator [Sphaerochaeta halotolerans]